MQKYFSGHNEESENSKKDEDSNAQIVENDQNDSTVMISYPNQFYKYDFFLCLYTCTISYI